jgi:chaperone modulatory protein CbpM
MTPPARADRPGQDRPATFALVRPARLNLESFARASGTHPELVTRLAALGLLDAERDAGGRLCFPPTEVAVMARIQRLRAGFALNYAALGLVLDLLDRLEAAEASLRYSPQGSGGRTWIRTG